MRHHAFCYFHARLHSTTKLGVADDFELPVPEDSAAIQESLGRLFQAILSSRVDPKKTSQLLWGLQIASHNLARRPKADPKSVPSVTRSKDGVELAPVFNVCDPLRECDGCPKAETCDRYFDFNALMGRKKKDDEDKPKRPTCEVDAKGEIVYKNSEGETIDRLTYWQLNIDAIKQHDEDEDDDDDDDDEDENPGKTWLSSVRLGKILDHTFDKEE
jgi:hypothetical protein